MSEQLYRLSPGRESPFQSGAGFPRSPIKKVGVRVVRAREPSRRTARFPTVAAPRLVSGLALARHRPQTPKPLAGRGIIGVEEAAHSRFAAADADDDFVLYGKRRRGNRVAQRVVRDLFLPAHRTGARVERHDVTVERPVIERLAKDGDTAIRPWKAERQELLGHRPRPAPERPPRAPVESNHRAGRLRDVHDAIDDDRRRLERAAASRLKDPDGTKGRDVVPRDRVQRRVAVRTVIARVSQPVSGLLVRVEDPLIGNLPKSKPRSKRRAEAPCDDENKMSHGSPLMLLR